MTDEEKDALAFWEEEYKKDPMECIRCNAVCQPILGIKIFKDQTRHIEARCSKCNKHSQYCRRLAPGDCRLDFGKHKGKRLREAPKDYVGWMAREMDDPWAKTAKLFLDQNTEGPNSNKNAPLALLNIPDS